MHNAGCALGKKVSLEECERACRTTATDGTNARKLKSGATRVGFDFRLEFREKRDEVAILLLKNWIDCGAAALITVDADSHWVAVVGRLGTQYLVADSADNDLVLGYSEGELLQRWRNSESGKPYYALILS